MKIALDKCCIRAAKILGVALVLIFIVKPDYLLNSAGIAQARAHANAAFQGGHVKTNYSCVGLLRHNISPGQYFDVYMESSNNRGTLVNWMCVAVKTSQNRRYELVKDFDYKEACAYGAPLHSFTVQPTESEEEQARFLQKYIEGYGRSNSTEGKIFSLRLLKSLDELDAALTDLGFKRQ